MVYQGSQRRTGCQFTFTCDGSLNRKPATAAWGRALSVARRALAGDVYAPVGLATHYHTTWVDPYWAPSLAHIGTIGAHRFYRWPGKASRPAAFSDFYGGGEPLPTPARAAAASEPAPDPVAVARRYEDALPSSPPGSEAAGAATSAGTPPTRARTPEPRQQDAAPKEGPGSVRPEYANSGRWIGQPN